MAEDAGEVGLAGAGGAGDEDGLAVADPLAGGEAEHEGAVEASGAPEVEVFDGRVEVELGVALEALVAALFPVGLLPFEEEREAVLEGEFGDVGHGGLLLERLCHAGQTQFAEQVERGLSKHDGQDSFRFGGRSVAGGGVVLRPADVGVVGGQRRGVRFVISGAVEPGGEDGLHRAVAEGADLERPAAGRFHALGGIGAGEAHEAEAAAVALFGVGPGFEESFDEGGGVGPDPAAPVDQSRRGPVRVGAVGGRHVGPIGGVGALAAGAEVNGDAPVPVEDLDGVRTDPNVDLAAGQRVRDTVEGVPDLDVVVDVDAGPAPLGVLVAPGGERLQRRTVQILEPAAPAAPGLLERPLVQRGHKRRDGTSEFAEREERLVARRRHDPAFDVLDRGLHLRLVPGFRAAAPAARSSRSGWPVPGRTGSDPARSGWPRGPPPLVVRDHEFGHPAEELEHPDVRGRPVGQRAAPRHIHAGVVRRRQHADEDHRVAHLAGTPSTTANFGPA